MMPSSYKTRSKQLSAALEKHHAPYCIDGVTIHLGDCRDTLFCLPSQSVNTCITSPPYWRHRDYGTANQIGSEDTPEEYIDNLVNVFRELRRVLKNDGTLWLNLGDSYSVSGRGGGGKQASNEGSAGVKPNRVHGMKRKQLLGLPWRIALALQADGWFLRQDIIWHKPNPMPESVTDRCTKAHEYIFLLSKSHKYYYDNKAIAEDAVTYDLSHRNRDDTRLNNTPGRARMGGLKSNTYLKRNKRSVWSVSNKPYKGAHFATYPVDLIEPCILAGCPPCGTVIDPFGGSGTTGIAAIKNGREAVLCEANQSYVDLARSRIQTAYLNLLKLRIVR